LIPETGPVTERLRVREIDDDEGQRLVRIIRRGSEALWVHQAAQDPDPVPGVLPLPPLPLSRHSEQRRDRLPADQFVLVKPYRGAVHGVAVLSLDGTDHASHKEQASMIRRYIIWRNHAYDERLRRIVDRANLA
jgi:hypothetical protein